MKKLAYKAKSKKHAAKIISYLLKKGTNRANIQPVYVNEYYWLDGQKDLCCTAYLPHGYKEAFLKSTPSKKELQQALSKVGEELSEFRQRLNKLESQLTLKNE